MIARPLLRQAGQGSRHDARLGEPPDRRLIGAPALEARDELDAAWKWVDPIREAWANIGEPPKGYTAGSWGPAASSALIGRDGFEWHGET